MNMKAIVTHYLPCKDRCTFPIVQWTIVHKYKENYPICYIIAMNPILVTPKKQYPYSPHADKQTVPRRTAP